MASTKSAWNITCLLCFSWHRGSVPWYIPTLDSKCSNFISSWQTECVESLPDIDLVNVFNIDIAGPQNMDPRNKFIYKLPILAKDFQLKVWISTWKCGFSPESVVYPPERICGVGRRVWTGGHFPHIGWKEGIYRKNWKMAIGHLRKSWKVGIKGNGINNSIAFLLIPGMWKSLCGREL